MMPDFNQEIERNISHVSLEDYATMELEEKFYKKLDQEIYKLQSK